MDVAVECQEQRPRRHHNVNDEGLLMKYYNFIDATIRQNKLQQVKFSFPQADAQLKRGFRGKRM